MSQLPIFRCFQTRELQFGVMLGTAAFLTASAPQSSIEAGWWPQKSARKAADENSSAEGKPAKGKSDATKSDSKSESLSTLRVRRMLNEAKAHEMTGDMDGAISLAERAAKAATAAAKLSKLAPDVTPEVAAKYVEYLHLKQTEQTVKNPIRKESEVAKSDAKAGPGKSANSVPPKDQRTAATDRKSLFAKSKGEKPAADKSDTATANRAPSPAAKTVAKADKTEVRPAAAGLPDSFMLPANKPTEPQPIVQTASVQQATTPNVAAETTQMPAAEERATPSQLSDSDWERDLLTAEEKPALPEGHKPIIASRDDASETASVNTEVAVGETPLQAASSDRLERGEDKSSLEVAESFPAEKPAPLKLRRSYVTDDLQASPSVSLRTDALPDGAWSVENGIVPTGGRKESKREPDRTMAPRAVTNAEKEEVRMRTYEGSDEAREQYLKELRDRLQSAAAFEPGAVAPGMSSAESAEAESELARTRVLRLRKRRQSGRPTTNAAEQATAGETSLAATERSSKPATVGQWKAAHESVAQTVEASSQKPDAQPDIPDLRQGLRGASEPFEERHERGSRSFNTQLADQSNGGSYNLAPPGASHKSDQEMSLTAPLPPSQHQVEWTSFDDSRENMIPADVALSESATGLRRAAPLQDDLETDGERIDAADLETEDTVPGGQGLSAATLWKLLGGAGFACVIVGLWIIRARVRASVTK